MGCQEKSLKRLRQRLHLQGLRRVHHHWSRRHIAWFQKILLHRHEYLFPFMRALLPEQKRSAKDIEKGQRNNNGREERGRKALRDEMVSKRVGTCHVT